MSLAIATRYATALADVLSGDKADTTPQAALDQLRDLQATLGSSPELRNLFSSPSVDVDSKKRVAATIGDRLGFSTSVRNLTFVLLVPTLPLAFATILNIEPEAKLMWIPSLSQHLLITTLIKDQPLDASFVAISVASSLAFGALLGWVAVRLYRREAILG